MKYSLRLIAFALLLPAVAAGQAPSVAPGTRVRITAPEHRLKKEVGSVEAVRGDSLVLLSEGSRQTIALDDVTRMEVSTGRRRQLIKHVGLGFAAGVVIGGAIGAITYKECVPDGFLSCFMASDSREQEAAWAGAALGIVGLAAGTVVGLVRRPERWEPVELPMRVGIAPARGGGVSLRLSRAF